MEAIAAANLWHQQLGHLNSKNLDLRKRQDHNGVSFNGTGLDCDICTVGKSHRLARPKMVDHKVKHPFQLVFIDLIGSITPEVLEGYNDVSNICSTHQMGEDFPAEDKMQRS